MRTRSRTGIGGAAAAVLLCVGGLGAGALAGCTNQAAQDLGGPISVIPATDVVVETNLQAVLQAAQSELATAGSFVAFSQAAAGGTNVTTGASTGPGQISYAVDPSGQGIVVAGWNHADSHCVGAVYIHAALPSAVLGATSPGQYDFIAPAASSSECDAATLVATGAAPTGWPVVPTANGWPPA